MEKIAVKNGESRLEIPAMQTYMNYSRHTTYYRKQKDEFFNFYIRRGLDFHTVAGQKIKDAGTVGTATAKIAGQEGWANGQQVAANGEVTANTSNTEKLT